MSKSKNIDIHKGSELVTQAGVFVRKYSLPLFLGLVGIVYAFILFQVQSLTTQQPTPDAVSSQTKGSESPKFDEKLVKQLQNLQDNSVNVKTLFEEARNNPFQ